MAIPAPRLFDVGIEAAHVLDELRCPRPAPGGAGAQALDEGIVVAHDREVMNVCEVAPLRAVLKLLREGRPDQDDRPPCLTDVLGDPEPCIPEYGITVPRRSRDDILGTPKNYHIPHGVYFPHKGGA